MKKYFIAFVAVVLAVGFSAFTKVAPRVTYDFQLKSTANPASWQDRIDPTKYDYKGVSGTVSCTSGTTAYCKLTTNRVVAGSTFVPQIIGGSQLESDLDNSHASLPIQTANEIFLKP